MNTWLPEQNTVTVPGTWALVDKEMLGEVGGLVFVYPRSGGLVGRYLEEAERVEVVVWIGPWCDVEEYEEVLKVWGVRQEVPMGGEGDGEEEEGGKLVEEGEVVLVYRRRTE